MHRRLILAGLAATGGLLTTVFLQAAVAVAEPAPTSAPPARTPSPSVATPSTRSPPPRPDGARRHRWPRPYRRRDRGLRRCRPIQQRAAAVEPGRRNSPCRQYCRPVLRGVRRSTGTELGSIDTGEAVTEPGGLDQHRIHRDQRQSFPPAVQLTSDLPAVGSVYDSFNLGNGYDNVYADDPRHQRRCRHRHRHAGHAERQRQPGLVVRQYRRRRAACSRATPSPVWARQRVAPTPSPSAATPWTPPWRPEARALTRSPPPAGAPPLLNIGGAIAQ